MGLFRLQQHGAAGDDAAASTAMPGGTPPSPLNLASAGFAGLGLYQAVNGQFLGSASSLLFYAPSARHMARTRDPDAAP